VVHSWILNINRCRLVKPRWWIKHHLEIIVLWIF
jgi:hypothetical protein